MVGSWILRGQSPELQGCFYATCIVYPTRVDTARVLRESFLGQRAYALNLVQRTMAVRKEIGSRYKWHKLRARLKEDILAFAKSKDVVLDAKWDNDAFLISFVSGAGLEFMELETHVKPFGWKKRRAQAEG